VPLVRTQEVKVLEEPRQLDLPGTMQAFDSATVFARATGYIASRVVDIGSKVHAGDLLATIAAPELDQQLEQARAQISQLEAALEQARSNAELARVTNERTSRLVGQGWSTKQQGDNDRTNFEAQTAAVRVAEANLQAQRAQVSRLEELTGFERVVAPFDGTITERQVDVGNLVTADTASGTPMFSIARTNVLRVQVYVPQNAVFGVSDGAQAQVSVPEMPGRTFHGTIARNANALQSSTRTRLTEVDVDNADGTLFAGLYCIVRFAVPRTSGAIVIPSEAIVFDRNGISAAVFDNGVARLRHLDIAVDEGAQVEVRAGLNAGDRVILNPPVNLADGMRVQSADAEQPKDAPPNK
jgi:RND family efflux transporter MFP subunit